MPDSGLKLFGPPSYTGLVVPSGAPVLVKAVAPLAKIVYGERIQICTGVNDHLAVQAALDAMPASNVSIKLLPGSYQFAGRVTIDKARSIFDFEGCDIYFTFAVGGE